MVVWRPPSHRSSTLRFVYSKMFPHAAASLQGKTSLDAWNNSAGQAGVSRHVCEASGCCFNPPGSGIVAPQCYYPANAEMSSYFASSLQTFGTVLATLH